MKGVHLYLCQSRPVSGLLLLREAINLSGNSVTQAQTKEHFGDVLQVLRQMTLIRLVLMGNLQKCRQSSLCVKYVSLRSQHCCLGFHVWVYYLITMFAAGFGFSLRLSPLPQSVRTTERSKSIIK